MAIPASVLVSVNPSVLAPGGTGLSFAGMLLTESTSVPTGAPTSFATAKAVGDYFGTSSTEYNLAKVYFQGFDTSNIKPGLLWIAQYPSTAVAAYVRGGAVTDLTAIQAITAGTLTVTIDGVAKTTTTLNLSAATSFSNAATLIATALSLAGGQTCTYSSQFNAFVIESGTTGVTSTITFGTGGAAATLGLTQAAGAVLSQGAAAVTSQSAYLDQLITYTSNWVTLFTTFEPLIAVKEAIATWVSGKNTRFLYAMSDSDITIIESPSTYTGFGYWAVQNNISGTAPVYNSPETAAMIAGMVASIDFTQLNGRVNFMFKTNNQVPAAVVSDLTQYDNMIANGYSSYCNFAVNQEPSMLANGQVTGSFKWIDSYVNAIWIAVSIQAAEIALLQQQKSLPYNPQGYALIQAAALDTINSALNFGAIRANVKPSSSEAAQMNAAAGLAIDSVVGTRGWYFQVLPADATTRAARLSPPVSLWYMDGESVQQLVISTVDVL